MQAHYTIIIYHLRGNLQFSEETLHYKRGAAFQRRKCIRREILQAQTFTLFF